MTNLSLFVGILGSDHLEIDLGDIWKHGDVFDEDTLWESLVVRIAVYALKEGKRFQDVYPMTVDDDDGEELSIDDDGNGAWIRQVAQLWCHLKSNDHHCLDEAVLAYIDNEGWGSFDFDSDFSTVEGNYHSVFDGDHGDFAREYMDNTGDALPSWAESFFDYESYGEALLEGYNKVSWRYTEYLFIQ